MSNTYERIAQSAREIENAALPMSPVERADLEQEAGHQFVSDEEAHRYRLRKLKNALVTEMLNEGVIKL
jgi:hypothetical protein